VSELKAWCHMGALAQCDEIGLIFIFEEVVISEICYFLKKKLRSILKDEGWREKKVGEGLEDDSEEDSQCLIYLFFYFNWFG